MVFTLQAHNLAVRLTIKYNQSPDLMLQDVTKACDGFNLMSQSLIPEPGVSRVSMPLGLGSNIHNLAELPQHITQCLLIPRVLWTCGSN